MSRRLRIWRGRGRKQGKGGNGCGGLSCKLNVVVMDG